MKNFIYQLYTGKFSQDFIKDKEYLEERNVKLEKASNLLTQLEKTFSAEQKKLLNELLETDADIWTDEVDPIFARGVKIGILFQQSLDNLSLE